MNASEYQGKAHDFASYGDNAMYPALGLAEEAGEVCGKVAKFIRKHEGDEPATVENTPEVEVGGRPTDDDIRFTADLRKELGDVLWMVAELCTTYGLDLDDVMRANIAKLADRKDKGLIIGEGDTNEERIANARRGR